MIRNATGNSVVNREYQRLSGITKYDIFKLKEVRVSTLQSNR